MTSSSRRRVAARTAGRATSRSTSMPTGTIASVTPGAPRDGASALAGPVIPAMPNLHSHAFQRAMAGRTGRAVARAATNRSGRGGRRCTRSSTASTPTRSRRSPRRRTSRWPRPATRRSPNSTTCITIPPASRTPIRRSSRCASSPRRARPASALTLLPVFYAHAGFGGTPPPRRSAASCTRPYTFTHLVDAAARARRGATASCSASRRTACAR